MEAKTIVSKLKKLNVHLVFRPIKPLLPAWLISWVQKNTVYDLVQADELKPQYNKACRYLEQSIGTSHMGDYLEFGVSSGTSLACMHEVLQELKLESVRLFGFDSFEGLPNYASDEDDGVWQPGQFKSEYEVTYRNLDKKKINWKKTFLIKGWFSDTLKASLLEEYQIQKASFIMIDCDIYSASKEALTFCAPLIKDRSIVFFDDWHTYNSDQKNLGEKKAFDEFLKENTHLKAQEFSAYNWYNRPMGKIFLVTNTASGKSIDEALPFYEPTK